ncbi:MAG: hypothetical protein AAF197_06950 [Pseudomonadota bacterium]
MSEDKKNLTGKEIDESAQVESTEQQEGTKSDRRRAVKNILAGSGVAAGAAASGNWVKPAVNAVITPAHAQTSNVITIVGNAAVGVPRVASAQGASENGGVLDMFINSANANTFHPSLDGSCLTMSIDIVNLTVSLLVEYLSQPSTTVTGTIDAMGNISGSDMASGISFTGTADTGAQTASGTISNSVSTYSFSLDGTTTACSPSAPTDTTAAPTTMYPTTTYYSTTTTPYPTTTYSSTTTNTTTSSTTPLPSR